ncbi:hypothetical protein JCM9279_006312 [Rhodotorula babjevae]
MPPDRHYTPQLGPVHDHDPLGSPSSSSHRPPREPLNSLGRGRACRDGVQPLCGPCTNAAARAGQDMSNMRCDFDTEEERRKPVGGGKVAALEAKIAALERRLAEVTSPSSASPAFGASTSRPPSASTPSGTPRRQQHQQQHHIPDPTFQYNAPPPFSNGAPAQSLPHFDAFAAASIQPHPQMPQPIASTSALPDYSFPPGAPTYPPQSQSQSSSSYGPFPGPFEPPSQSFANAYWHPAPAPTSVPGNPRLPSPLLLERLVNIFFDYPHEAVDLVSRRRFMDAFSLGAAHPDYPAQSLLHAMVATATDLAGDEVWDAEERYWGSQGPAEYHADFADVLIPLGFRTERNILQVAQAAVLFACFNLYHGRFSSAYIDTSVAVRICISLGLNHESYSLRDLPLSSFLSHRTFLTPPRDEEEMMERATTWWFALTVETFSAAATGWACCIDERDITTLIPAASPFGDDPTAREALYLHSPSFFSLNPPHLVRLVQINLKVTVLMNRVCTFVHRTTALANATPDRSALGPSDFPKIRASPAFTKLESALENFGRKAPAQLVTLLEPEAFLCPSLVATSVILLHERFCTSDEQDPSMVKCAEACRNIFQNMQVLNSASFHPRQIPPFLTFCWGVAGRTFLRELAIRQLRGVFDGDEAAQLRSCVQAICARLEQTRTPLGPNMAAALLVMLDHPDICLPSADAAVRNPPGVSSIARLTSLLDAKSRRGGGAGAGGGGGGGGGGARGATAVDVKGAIGMVLPPGAGVPGG